MDIIKDNKQKKDNNNNNISVIVNHIHHPINNANIPNGYNNFGLPKLPPPIPQPIELTTTKKSIGINLSKMKAKNYEDNVKRKSNSLEMHNLPNIPNEGNENESENENINQNINEIEEKIENNYKGKGHRYMESLTNINDEGIGVFDNIISDTKIINQINDNDEESSSFTMGSAHKNNEKNDNNKDQLVSVDKNGNLLVPQTSETKRYKLPKPITKGQWL
eukprot:7495_1